MRLDNEPGITFDDVLLVPQYSDVKHRKNVNINTYLSDRLPLDIPIISANMDTITELPMALAMNDAGGLGIIHRYISVEDMAEIIKTFNQRRSYGKIGVAIGVNEIIPERAEIALELGVKVILIDVAHAHHSLVEVTMDQVVPLVQSAKATLIVGNVATEDGAIFLMNLGADAIKVGIGPGSICTTRIVTGHGVPQLTAIADVYNAVQGKCRIIADGGIRNSGDIVKAIGFGADAVMLGSLLAGTDETPSMSSNPESKVVYRGMASREANSDRSEYTPEGISHEIKRKGPVRPILENLCGGIRSGFSYSGCSIIHDFQRHAVFKKVSSASVAESLPHIRNIT